MEDPEARTIDYWPEYRAWTALFSGAPRLFSGAETSTFFLGRTGAGRLDFFLGLTSEAACELLGQLEGRPFFLRTGHCQHH